MNGPATPVFPLPTGIIEVVAIASKAFYVAVDAATPPAATGDHDDDPSTWASPEDFIETLCDYFRLKLQVHAADNGVEAFEELRPRLAAWEAEGMGHGCPALLSGADVPPVASQGSGDPP